MEKNDLKIEFRAVRAYGDCHILQYRFSPGQDLAYEVEKNWFGGLLRFKLKKEYSTKWDSPLYFTGSFTSCGALTEIEIPATLKVLPGTFHNCTSLQNVILHEGLEKIEDYAFQGCTSLTEIAIPTSVTQIDSYAFDSCSNLTVIYYSGTATGSPWGASNATVLPNPN